MPDGIVIQGGSRLQASGDVIGRIASTILATGDLELGDANSVAGFFSDGDLYVGTNTVTINDSNIAVLGSLTSLGDGTAGGTLTAGNANTSDTYSHFLLEQGENLVGRGTVNGHFINHGDIYGDGTEPDERIVFASGYEVSGNGSFVNTEFLGDYNPGNSPASVDVEDVTLGIGSTLNIELGGTVAGDEYDQLNSLGTLTLGGNLGVSLINSFALDLGQQFKIVDNYGTVDGEFFGLSQGNLVSNLGGVGLYITYLGGDGNDIVLFTSSANAGIPEPSTLALLGLGMLGMVRHTRRRRA